jgi:hydrogenase expression/formation protein HypC
MCLAIPGRITEVWNEGGALFATADFAGEDRKVCLNFLPELVIGDYVIVHAGFALSKIDQAQVDEVMESMREAGLLEDFAESAAELTDDNLHEHVESWSNA